MNAEGPTQPRDPALATLPDHVARTVSDPARREVLSRLRMMDTVSDPDFDRLTRTAATLFDAPIALISLVDLDRQWFKSCIGLSERATPIGMSFCAHTIASESDILVVEDARADPRFLDNPLVTGGSTLRFYAGAPLIVHGARIGSLCVIDNTPRDTPDPRLLARLTDLAALASSLFALKDSSHRGSIAAAALDRAEKRHKLALETANIASWIWDIDSNTVECDPLLPELFGLAPATRVNARKLFFAIDRRDLRRTDEELSTALRSGDYAGEYRIKDTSPVGWVATRGRVIERSGDGKARLVIGVTYNVSERKWTEESQRVLLRELNHRVKNTLATVQALASQTVRHAREPREFLDAFSARLQALGRAHGLLSDREWRGIGLEELIRQQTEPFDDPVSSRVRTGGPPVWLPPDQAVALGLILHELASNALKYGALSVSAGAVDIRWRLQGAPGERSAVLHWLEEGGPQVSEPERRGFGSILIRRSLDKVLTSNVNHEFLPGGVHAQITLPLDAATS